MHENTITVILVWKGSRASSFLFSLPRFSLSHQAFTATVPSALASVWNSPYGHCLCCASSPLLSSLSLSPILTLRSTICPSCDSSWGQSSDNPLEEHGSNLLLSGRQCTGTFANVFAIPSPPISPHAYSLQHPLLLFTSLPVMWYSGKQHVPGSSCTLPLRRLLHKECDCLNQSTIYSPDVNFSFSLAWQCKLCQFGGTVWVMNREIVFSFHACQTCTPSSSIPYLPVLHTSEHPGGAALSWVSLILLALKETSQLNNLHCFSVVHIRSISND